MKRYLSTKNTFTVLFLWGFVVFFIVMLALALRRGEVSLIAIIIISSAIAVIMWILLDTRYVIKNTFLLYRSGPFRGRIDIQKMQKIRHYSSYYSPCTMKPSLDTKGFIITYNKFDDIFVSPNKAETFIAELLKINPEIEVI